MIDQHERCGVLRQRRQRKTQGHAPRGQLAKQVLLDIHPDHAGDGAGPLGIDGHNARMRLGAAHKTGMTGVVHRHIVEKARLTAQQLLVFNARHALPNAGARRVGGHADLLPSTALKACTAFKAAATMFW